MEALKAEAFKEAVKRVDQQRKASPYSKFRRRYWDDPVGFVCDCIKWRAGERLALYQARALDAVVHNRRHAVRGPHGLGKTAIAALAVLWFALTRDSTDWKVVTTASAWRQLTHYLWPEIHKWVRRIKWARIGRQAFDSRTELLTLQLKLTTGQAFAVASDNSDLIEGAHAAHLLYVYDEAKAIPIATWDAAEGALASGDCYALAVSTPGEPAGRFYDIHARRPGYDDWTTCHVSLLEAIGAGRVSVEWARQRGRQWGIKSAVYQNRVLGEFAASEEDSVIPLAWIEAANERWLAWKDGGGSAGPLTSVGVDVGRGGDKTVLALRAGNIITELRRSQVADVMDAAGRTKGVLDANPDAIGVIDIIGVGAGTYDRLREQGVNVLPFVASASVAEARDRSGELGFVNLRAAAWWRLRELLEPGFGGTIALPPDALLTGDLTAPKQLPITSTGKIRVESKEQVAKRIGRSTDDGDAVVEAFAVPELLDAGPKYGGTVATVELKR